MKQYIFAALSAALLSACGNSTTNSEHSNHDTTKAATTTSPAPDDIKKVSPTFASLDASVSGHMQTVFEHYLQVKTALVNGNGAEAKSNAAALLQALRGFDKSLLPADQKAAYDKSAGAMKVSAGNIAGTEDVKKQREHFATLSNQAYDLAKNFGAGKTVYHEHCPMAFDNKGAMWLSESKEVKNPYYGSEMLECGTVEEVIQK